MKITKIIKRAIIIIVVLVGAILLIGNWEAYKDILYKDIIEKIIKSDFDRSLEQDNLKIKNEPNNPWNYIYRGSTYKKNKKYSEALSDYIKAYTMDKKFSYYVFDDISNIYLAMGNTEKAIEFINKSIKIEPYPEAVLFDLAIIFDSEWKSQYAIDTYSKYITLNNIDKIKDKYLFSLKRRAIHYVLMKQYEKAKEDVNNFEKRNPHDQDVKLLNDVMSKKKDIDESIIKEKFKLDVYKAITVNDDV